MRLAAVALVALAFAPVPAAADVAAIYEVGKETLSIEVDDGGDYRAEIAGKFALLRLGAVEYVVIFQGAKPLVVERQAFLALAARKLPATPPKAGATPMRALVSSAGEETIAGRFGTLWKIKLDTPSGNTLEAVMSPDRELAPVGAIFAGVLEAGLQVLAPMIPASDFPGRIREIFAKGTPLRLVMVEKVALRSVSTAALDAKRFALPAAPMDSAAFDAAMSASIPTHAEKVEITPPPEPPPLP